MFYRKTQIKGTNNFQVEKTCNFICLAKMLGKSAPKIVTPKMVVGIHGDIPMVGSVKKNPPNKNFRSKLTRNPTEASKGCPRILFLT